MTIRRVRVRRPISVRGLFVVALLSGVLLGASAEGIWRLLWPIVESLELIDPGTAYFVFTTAVGIVLLLFVLLFTIAVASICQRLFVNAAAAAIMVAAWAATSRLVDFLTPPFQPITTMWDEDTVFDVVGFLVAVPAAAAIAAVVAVIVTVLLRATVWRIVDQDGTLCHRCGYSITQSGATTCPECGTAAADGEGSVRHRAHRLTHWLGDRWRRFAIALLGLTIGAILWIGVLEVSFVRFERTFADWHKSWNFADWNPDLPDLVWAANREREIADEDGAVTIRVALARPSSVSPAVLSVTVVLESDEPANPNALAPSRGPPRPDNFRVVAEPPRDVTRRILREGLDDSTIRILIDQARRTKESLADASDEADWRRATMEWPRRPNDP